MPRIRAASSLIGCDRSTVGTLVHNEHLVTRGRAGTVMPSLQRASVEAVAVQWAEGTRERAEVRRRSAEAAAAKRPPDDGHVWLDLATTALVLGLSRNGVRWLAERERLPGVQRGRSWWFRRDHVEQAAAARGARARRKHGI